MTHYMKNKRLGKVGYAAVKLDMSKAYDRVEWSFLQKMMEKLGFCNQWVEVIMKFVSSVSYRIKVNGDLSEEFFPERGLRQGDPLSPYLFLIYAEGFSALLRRAEEEGKIKGIKICPGAPSVSHLLFADDSLILCRANGGDAQQLQSLLQVYEECSGQMINKDKSAVMFSPNTPTGEREEVMSALQIAKETTNERYLGLPVYVGKEKSKVFQFLKERIWQRIQGWKEKLLSRAGKEILIKAVAQAIPTYAMTCFDITKGVCEQISSMICKYWWSNQDKDRKMHWISWDTLTKSKNQGGLGFRDIHIFNLAMLAKQGWRLLHSPDSFCGRILKAKYFPKCSVLEAKPRGGISYTWRSILNGIEVIKSGLVWRVGNGESIKIWEDPWIPDRSTRRPISSKGHNLLVRVAELLDPLTGSWNEQLVQQTFEEEDVKFILAIPLQTDMEDIPAWHADNRGIFSVRSAYKVHKKAIRQQSRQGTTSSSSAPNAEEQFWKKLWKIKCPGKIKHFAWRLAHNTLALRMTLRSRNGNKLSLCDLTKCK
ncbi:hypothetical protein U9M48_023324 [Paspalum notatum var. saurae]|uniref:Reverse transcriptase domain-containing protein n=1 Tax=Paspalum notatum var. saurae TaxID=547442 RepID=A0AAQ3WVP9_PASNO